MRMTKRLTKVSPYGTDARAVPAWGSTLSAQVVRLTDLRALAFLRRANHGIIELC